MAHVGMKVTVNRIFETILDLRDFVNEPRILDALFPEPTTMGSAVQCYGRH